MTQFLNNPIGEIKINTLCRRSIFYSKQTAKYNGANADSQAEIERGRENRVGKNTFSACTSLRSNIKCSFKLKCQKLCHLLSMVFFRHLSSASFVGSSWQNENTNIFKLEKSKNNGNTLICARSFLLRFSIDYFIQTSIQMEIILVKGFAALLKNDFNTLRYFSINPKTSTWIVMTPKQSVIKLKWFRQTSRARSWM